VEVVLKKHILEKKEKERKVWLKKEEKKNLEKISVSMYLQLKEYHHKKNNDKWVNRSRVTQILLQNDYTTEKIRKDKSDIWKKKKKKKKERKRKTLVLS